MQISPSQLEKTVPDLRIQSLASGSSGNAYILQSSNTRLLIDCGIGIRQIQAGLLAWNIEITELDGVLITHEHSDHVRALDAILRRRLPVYCTKGTGNALGLSASATAYLSYGETYDIRDISILPVRTSHDAAEPCGLVLTSASRTIGLFTDMGIVTDDVSDAAHSCDLLIFESNHDREMLRMGPYSQYLKARVSGNLGHLSNDQAGGFLSEIASTPDGPTDIWLAHLSGTNNTPRVALDSVSARLGPASTAPSLAVLPRGGPGPIWDGTTNRARQLHLLADM